MSETARAERRIRSPVCVVARGDEVLRRTHPEPRCDQLSIGFLLDCYAVVVASEIADHDPGGSEGGIRAAVRIEPEQGEIGL